MSDNPFKSDQKLQQMLADVSTVQSGETLSHWKASFLKVYKSYLEPDGVLNARDADDRLVKKLESLAKTSLKVQSFSESGHISKDQITADGHRALGNWTEEMTLVENEVSRFCPKTSEETDAVGYDKFELGAVLIQDGFRAYEIMLNNSEFIQELSNGPLQGILDRNQLSIIDYYSKAIKAFIDIMSDLGLMKLMAKCVAVYEDEPRPDLANEPDILTEPDKEELVVDVTHESGPDTSGSTSKGSKKKVTGKAGGVGKDTRPGEKNRGVGKDDARRPPNEDEEPEEPPPDDGDGDDGGKIIYFDPKTGNIGLLQREKCLTNELMFVQDASGGPVNNGVIESVGEKGNIVWLLKKLEKTKPKEGEWLEKIKAEKTQKIKEGHGEKSASVRVSKDSVPESRTKPKPAKRPVKKLTSTKDAGPRSSGFKNPLEESSGPKKSKGGVQDYNGIYQKAAPKPGEGGWNKVASDETG